MIKRSVLGSIGRYVMDQELPKKKEETAKFGGIVSRSTAETSGIKGGKTTAIFQSCFPKPTKMEDVSNCGQG